MRSWSTGTIRADGLVNWLPSPRARRIRVTLCGRQPKSSRVNRHRKDNSRVPVSAFDLLMHLPARFHRQF